MAKFVKDKRNLTKANTAVVEPVVEKDAELLFDKTNYIIVLVGILFIILGFILMAGGGSSDPTVFDADAVYSARRITLAPIMIILGFIIEIYAIVKKPQ